MERKAEELRLMRAYPQVAFRSTWAAFYTAGMAAWKQAHPEPPKPILADEPINLSSTSQVLQALRALSIPVTCTQDEELARYAARYPVVERLRHRKDLHHFITAFGENLLSHVETDGRIHATFAQLGAVSGRVICHSPNLQQIPKPTSATPEEENLRRCFVAAPGYKLLVVDLPNIELRILADVAADKTMLRLFAEGRDMHAETAKLMFHLPDGVDTRKHLYKGVPVRDIAKTINFGLAYGMGVRTLAERAGVDEATAKALMNRYFSTYRSVAAYLKASPKQALARGYAVTLGGRKRWLPQGVAQSALAARVERSARNHPIQGTNADILKRALALLYEQLPKGAYLVLTVHDEIVVEARDARVGETERVLKQEMGQSCREFLPVVAIPEPEVLIGEYWQKD